MLREGLATIADASQQIMVVTDDEGRVLWRQGHTAVLRRAEDIGLEEGAAWAERATGTNAIGTALAARTPVQVHSAEHFVARPAHLDLRGGPGARPAGRPAAGRRRRQRARPPRFHPATLALVTLGGAARGERAAGAAPGGDGAAAVGGRAVLCRLAGRALVVDPHGWTAAVTGMPPVDRLALPKSLGRAGCGWPRSAMCTVEPLPGGWLLRVAEGAARTARRAGWCWT